jgi:thiol-disulfide isomerase/thioredoxin
MSQPLWQRRKLLTYLGLGAIAALSLPADRSPGIDSQLLAATYPPKLPEFRGISEWIDSSPLTPKDLLGKVVLIQIWTLGCINCQRTLPYVVNWHKKYAAKGLQTIGIHTPEFPFERDPHNIRRAMSKYGINYPVAVDNNFETWKAYNNQYWPHLFLADRQGRIQYDHIGEGAYAETETKIRQLLGKTA